MARLAAGLAVSALIRRVHQAGGSAMVLARGDQEAGGILILTLDRGGSPRFFERGIGRDGRTELLRSGPETIQDDAAASAYWRRRRESDPDLWVVELDVADSERFAAETIISD